MKRRIVLMLLAAVAFVVSPAKSQNSATNLVMGAHWDNQSYIQGTVTLAKMNVVGADTVIITKTLSQGWTNVNEPLGANSIYNVTLRMTNGTQLVKFPITTALINPANLKRAEIDLVCHAADNSLASAQFTVSMSF
jgi:hypothetical protein